jgi:hypothetical protein
MNARKLLLLLGLTIAATGTASAAVHSVSYKKVTAAAGTVVTFGGTDYTIVRIPFATFDQLRYSVFLPVATEGGFAFIQTTHTDAALSTNTTIDGVPARIKVGDSRTYAVQGLPGVSSQFNVSSDASVVIDFKIGNTLVTITLNIDTAETNANAGAAVDYRSKAEWAKYTDLTAKITALNNLIDYIRIIAPAP